MLAAPGGAAEGCGLDQSLKPTAGALIFSSKRKLLALIRLRLFNVSLGKQPSSK